MGNPDQNITEQPLRKLCREENIFMIWKRVKKNTNREFASLKIKVRELAELCGESFLCKR